MIHGNTSDIIGHPLPEDSISNPHMGPPTMPGPRAPHHLNLALQGTELDEKSANPAKMKLGYRNPIASMQT